MPTHPLHAQRQSAFDRIFSYFSAPDAKLSSGKGDYLVSKRCYYRHPDDPSCRCAAGCILPDDLYDPTFDDHERQARQGGAGVRRLPDMASTPEKAMLLRQWLNDNGGADFLSDCQDAHDSATSVDECLAALRKVGRIYRLIVPE